MAAMKRRDLLRSAGLVTLFAPFIDLLEPKRVRAASTAGFDNLLIFFTNGTDIPSWTPKGSSDTSITFSQMTAPLDPIKQNLILVENLNGNGTTASHGAPGGLTGQGYGPPTQISVEQWISDRLPQAPIKNVLLGSVSTEQQSTFYRAGMAISPIFSVTAAYQALFNGFTPPAGAEQQAPATSGPDPKSMRRQSSLDLIKDELSALSQSLGPTERQKLDLHADSIRQLEQTLTSSTSGGGSSPTASCSLPDMPTSQSEVLLNSATHLQLAIAALACGRTRVAAVQFGHHQNTQVSLQEVGAPGDWHNTFCHSDMPPRTRLVNLERWLCGQFVTAVNKLQSIPLADGSGTLLDRTLVFWARDMGDAVVHAGDNMRFVFAGGGNYLKFSPNGRYIDGKGAPHQNALISVCEALGVSDYSGFGDQSHPRVPLSGLTA
jgi:hypothetical protein